MSNLNIIQGAYEAFAKGDVPAVLGIMDANIVWKEADGFPLAGTYNGPQGVLEGVFMRLGPLWEGFTVTPQEFIDGGNPIVVLGQYSGKAVATGKPLQVDFAHIWKFQDGKVIRFVQYVDTLIVQQSLTA
ncbi:MAG TPA: nuclear transport factor 2 family protein [Blastocatellia bacterium]|nr:nuclear transport factor 2 family protein [Blastocatellia bacterium]